MGLFDYVNCKYPLPGNVPECAKDAVFQTKDLTCYMMHYTISADGRLIEDSGEESWSDFTGSVDLYWDNVVASGPGIYTRDGEDAHFLEYTAVFVNGWLASITEVTNQSQRAARNKPTVFAAPTQDEAAAWKARLSESLTGRTMCLWWGGDAATPHMVKVIAESERDLVVQHENAGEFEIVSRHQLDSCLHDSLEDAQRYKDDRAAKWNREREEYEAEIGAKART